MVDSNPPEGDMPGREVFIGNIEKDLFNGYTITYKLCRQMGYPLELQEGATDYKGKPLDYMWRVMTDSKDTMRKIGGLFSSLSKVSTFNLISNLEMGNRLVFIRLLGGEDIRDGRYPVN